MSKTLGDGGAGSADTHVADVVRLNLGCGDKPLPGYINVDMAPSRGGMAPDVIADIRHMEPFGPDYADEIMAIHVIEHIDRWEVVDVLRHWLAVLKPGGRLVLETPNLISACKALLADPLKAARAGKTGQMSMWPLYGDPSWQDPLMMHKWLYTPQSLGEVMHEAGFVGIKQTPAQFKLKEPRDMRLVGSKPYV